MREVFVHQDFTRVGYYHSILQEAGITAFIRNERVSSAEAPAPAFFPSVCVINDEDYERALTLLREVHQPAENDLPDWHCAKCNEDVPGNFQVCWKCGEPAATPPQ